MGGGSAAHIDDAHAAATPGTFSPTETASSAGERAGAEPSPSTAASSTPDPRRHPQRPRSVAIPLLSVLLAPTSASALLDVARRGHALAGLGALDLLRYLATGALSAGVFGAMLLGVLHPRRVVRWPAGLAFFLCFSVANGTQAYFRDQTASYFNLDAARFGAAFAKTVRAELWRDAPALARAHLPSAAVALALLTLAAFSRRRMLGGSSGGARHELLGGADSVPSGGAAPSARVPLVVPLLAPLAVVGSLAFAPIPYRGAQPALPDVLALHALVGLAHRSTALGISSTALAGSSAAQTAPHDGATTTDDTAQTLPGRRSPEYLPALLARPEKQRNVVLIVTESVRSDVFCSGFSPAPDCATNPRTNAALPHRMPLLQMRANDSATAVSVAVLLTGVAPSASREDMHRAPTLWEYAAAAGWDTAYWTSQNLSFGNSDMWVRDIGVEKRTSALELDKDADLDLGANDSDLATYVRARLPTLREPFFAVIHLSNTHFPYRIEERLSPFQPAEFTKDPAKNDAFFNYYKNAVALQDEAIGSMVEAVRAMPQGPRTIIAFTSDHGEAFREHGQIGHTLSVFDEEVHVPAFVDAPEGTLTPSEHAALENSRNRPVFHTDIAPTILDWMGLWTAPELSRGRSRMVGESLLRAPRGPKQASVPLTNCAAVWGCPFKNWGMMQGKYKLEARQWDDHWHCFDVIADPHEKESLGLEPPTCQELATSAARLFGGLPGHKDAP